MAGVIRSKGFFWLASRMDWVGELSTVGGATKYQAAGFWFAARHRVDAGQVDQSWPSTQRFAPIPFTDAGWQREQRRRWTAALPRLDEVADPQEHAAMKKLWDVDWGDRRQELAIIGVNLKEQSVRKELDACLLTDAEMQLDPGGWQEFPDPFPRWRRAE